MFSLCKTFPFAVNEIEPTNRWLVVRVCDQQGVLRMWGLEVERWHSRKSMSCHSH